VKGIAEGESGRVRSPLHCVTKRATRPTKSLSTLMRVPRCVKIPRRRNNIGRAYAVSRSLSLSLSLFLSPLLCALVSLPSRSSSRVRAEALRANCRWRLLSSLSLSLSFFIYVIFFYLPPAIHRRWSAFLPAIGRRSTD